MRRASSANIHHCGRRSPTGATQRRGVAQERVRLQVAGEQVAALEVVGHGQHVGGERRRLGRAGVDGDEHVELAERVAQRGLPGDGEGRVADPHEERPHVPAADLVGQRGAR